MSGTNYNNTHNTSTAGAGIGGKVKGSFEVIHGISDSVRAQGMSALDNLLGTTQKNEEHARLAEQGRLETETGISRLRGRNTTTGASHGFGTGPHAVNEPIHPQGTESLGDGQANITVHGYGGGVRGTNTTENHNARTGFGIGGPSTGSHPGDIQTPHAPPELPPRNNLPPNSQSQMYD